MEAAVDAVCAESIEDLTAGWRRGGLGLIPTITGQASPVQLGGTSYADVLSRRLHIGKGAARRRIADAEQLAPRLHPPRLPRPRIPLRGPPHHRMGPRRPHRHRQPNK